MFKLENVLFLPVLLIHLVSLNKDLSKDIYFFLKKDSLSDVILVGGPNSSSDLAYINDE